MKILFVDAFSERCYTRTTLSREALGGTEATLLRVAEALAARHSVKLSQQQRPATVADGPLELCPDIESLPGTYHPDAVILVRRPELVTRLRSRFPAARLYYWEHNFWKPRRARRHCRALAAAECTVVAVSRSHAEALRRAFESGAVNRLRRIAGALPSLDVRHVYNPVEPRAPAAAPWKANKLMFVSSANKGLRDVLETFFEARRHIPDLELFVAHPGYRPLRDPKLFDPAWLERPGVHVLEALPQAELHRHVGEALCIFYPQSRFPETFGLVYAEANALGTPVLAHDFGAAREVLSNPDAQLLNARDREEVVARLRSWRQGNRPVVHLRDAFRPAAVLEAWEALLSVRPAPV